MFKVLFLFGAFFSIIYANPMMDHTPPEYLKPNLRTTLHVGMLSDLTLTNQRLYFKSSDSENFNFVNLKCDAEDCSGVLPKANPTTLAIEYLFLAVDSEKKIYKTKHYVVNIQDYGDTPISQGENSVETIVVLSELETPPKELKGFSDDLVIDSVESTARFGVVAGLYTQITASAATTGGISTTTMVAGGAAVVAGGAALALSGGGDSDGGSEVEAESEPVVTTAYDLQLEGDSSWSGVVYDEDIYKSDDICTYQESSSATRSTLPLDKGETHSGTCSFSYSNNIYTFETDEGARYVSSSTSQEATSFKMTQEGGSVVLTFTKRN